MYLLGALFWINLEELTQAGPNFPQEGVCKFRQMLIHMHTTLRFTP